MEVLVFDRDANLFLAESGAAPCVEFDLDRSMVITVIAKAEGWNSAAVPQVSIERTNTRMAIAA
jgi:hypothetical protein